MNSKLQGGMSLCQSFLRLPVTKQVRKKCHCCILAEDKINVAFGSGIIGIIVINLSPLRDHS